MTSIEIVGYGNFRKGGWGQPHFGIIGIQPFSVTRVGEGCFKTATGDFMKKVLLATGALRDT